jgi:hypothetical protein
MVDRVEKNQADNERPCGQPEFIECLIDDARETPNVTCGERERQR